MEKRKNVNINYVQFENITKTDLFELLNKDYLIEENGFSFKDIELNEEIISGTLVKRRVSFISDYISETKTFEPRTIYLFSETIFSIDLENGLLYSIGAVNNFNAIKSTLRYILPRYELSNINLTILQLVNKIKQSNVKFNIQEIAINKFSYENSITGKFIGQVTDSNIAIDLLKKYNTDVYRICIKIIEGSHNFNLIISSSDSFGIYGEEDYFEHNLNFIKHLIQK